MARARLWRRLAALAVCGALASGAACAEPIQPGYDLSIRVSVWNSSSGEMKIWDGWPKDYTVDAQDRIALPILGQIDLTGMSPSDLAQKVSDGLIEQLSLADLPAVSVEITDRPPVMVLGLVRNAGPVTYRDGITVREALALAGGVPLTGDAATDPIRTRLEARAQIEQLRQSEAELLAKSARLKAEIAGQETVSFPPLPDLKNSEAIKAREQQILTLDTAKRKRGVDLLDGRIALLKKEIEALDTKRDSLQTQQDLAKKQLDAITKLSDRGLTVNANLLNAQQVYTSIESQALELRSSILSAQQDIAKAESDRLLITQGETADALRELATVSADLDQVQSKRALQERLAALIDAASTPDANLNFKIYHRAGAQPGPGAADQVLKPGDIVQVSLAAPDTQG